MNSLKGFPTNKELRLAVLTALHNLGGVGKTSDINKEVAA